VAQRLYCIDLNAVTGYDVKLIDLNAVTGYDVKL